LRAARRLRIGYPESEDSLLRSSSRRLRMDWCIRGRAARSSGFHPQAVWPDRKVHRCERCESSWVADQPFALHAEALDRRGRSTRLAPPVRAGVATRIAGRLSPCCIGVLPGIPARTHRTRRDRDRESQPFPHAARAQYRDHAKIAQVPIFLRLTTLRVDGMWTGKCWSDRRFAALSTRCGIVHRPIHLVLHALARALALGEGPISAADGRRGGIPRRGQTRRRRDRSSRSRDRSARCGRAPMPGASRR
jgi:hypothetical protein